MLMIHSSAFYVIGVYAAAEVIGTVLATLDGQIIEDDELPLSAPPLKEQFLQMMKERIRLVIKQSRAEIDSLIGIGVAMHGLVDPQNGVAVFAPHLNLESIPIKDELEQEFNIPALVENDVRTLALAESWYGEGQGIANFVCISVGLGVGSGIVLNDEVYSGMFHTAGELGHTVIDINGPRCRCGNYGCLEAYVSESAILSRVQKAIRLGKETLITAWLDGDSHLLTIEMIFTAAEQGDQLALEVLEDAGRYLGIASQI